MRTCFFTIILLFHFLYASGQDVFTGSILIEESEYAGIAGNLPQTPVADLPYSIDLSEYLPPVGDQGNQNSCVAFAIAYGAQTYYAKKGKDIWTYINNTGQLNYDNIFSPSFVYNQINRGVDEGSSYIEALNLLKDQGVCTWSSMPYFDNDFRSSPTQTAKEQAGNFKIERYFRLGERQDLLSDVKEQLANSHPVIASAISDINYLRGGYGNNPNNPYVWTTIGSFNPRMGHAILIVGYDDNRQAFKFLNSYGRRWGNDGFGWINYSIFNGVVKQAFTMKPSFTKPEMVNTIVKENRNTLNSNDINIGLNLSVNFVQHMNSYTHPQILPQNRIMTVSGLVSVPNNIGSSAQIIIYYYLIDPSGRRTPLPGFLPGYSLQSGQAISSTPTISTTQEIINLGWYSTIPYYAFPRYGSFSTPARTYIVEAEPALIVDNYPVRLGTSFQFTVTQ
ncbi:C1 family peptidase [Aquiflexum lacus]|uniref:C1 family peptidase n=1 Tax=Aquiflexum lacus TaxID=2483805 RepID=UPI001895CB3C|nr:C1 family peptidase [Aquiflexum lacus]